MPHCYRSYKSVTCPAATTHWQLFLQDVALDLMQVDDPRLYEMIATKEAIFAWEIKSGANVVRWILFGCVPTELKRSRYAHVPPRSHDGVFTPRPNTQRVCDSPGGWT